MNTKLLIVGVLCIFFGLFIGFSTCQKCEEVHITPNVYGLPLSEFWKIILEKTRASNNSALNWFYAETDDNGNLNHLILEFVDNNNDLIYHVEYVNGKLKYYTAKANGVKSCLHPLTLFRELEKLDFREILQDYPYKSFVIDAEMESGSVGYSSNYTKIYLLSNGSLIPLKRIVFSSKIPWCAIEISKMKYIKNGSIVVGHSVGGLVVFLSEDLDKSVVIEPSIKVTPRRTSHRYRL